jgi:hypothetical protein
LPTTTRLSGSERVNLPSVALSSGKRKASEPLERSRTKRRSTRGIEEEAARLLGALRYAESDTEIDTEIDE